MPNERNMSGLVEPQGRGEEPLYFFTRIYLLFLQGLFKQFPEGSYRWSDDENVSEISILNQVPIPKDRIEQRPAIITMRGPAQFANLTLDQMRTVDTRTGAKTRTDLVACTMTLNCIAKLAPEAQRIAWIVLSNLRRFKELLQRTGGFHKIGDEVSIGGESPPGAFVSPEADTEFVMVSVQSPFFFQWTETVTPLDTVVLEHIELHLRAGLPDPASVTTQASVEFREKVGTPTIRGRAIGLPTGYTSHPIDQKVKT